jgi:hypothetical protein
MGCEAGAPSEGLGVRDTGNKKSISINIGLIIFTVL